MFTFFADSEKPEQEMLVNYIGLLVTVINFLKKLIY